MNVHVLWSFWWLIFPLSWMVIGTIRMILRSSYERKKLDVLKAYLDKGKDVPPGLYRDF